MNLSTKCLTTNKNLVFFQIAFHPFLSPVRIGEILEKAFKEPKFFIVSDHLCYITDIRLRDERLRNYHVT